MKKICILAVMAVMAVAASAQLYVGGSVGAWRDDNNSALGCATTQISIMPEIGYNLNDNWAVGTTIGYEYTHVTEINTSLFNFQPYARYTFVKFDKVSLFCDGTAGFGVGKSSYKEGGSSKTASVWTIGFKPGIALNLNEHCSLVAHFGLLGYQGANDEAKDAGYSDQWGLNFSGNNLSFGFYYTF